MARKPWLLVLIGASLLIIAACSDENNPVVQANGILSGRVTVQGVGVSGVTITVSAFTITSDGTPRPEASARSAQTTAAGDYFFELLPGAYRIEYDIILDYELLHTARYPLNVIESGETRVDVDLKDPIPANLIVADDDAAVLLTWEHSYGAGSYNIYRAPSADPVFDLVAEADSGFGTIRRLDSPPVIGSYIYRITGVTEIGESLPSDSAETYFSGRIMAPTGFSASDYVTHVYLAWNSKTNASYYKIYRAENSPNNWVVMDSTAGLSYADVPSTFAEYHYYITAISPLGAESEPSSIAAVEYDGIYDPPSGLTLIDRGSNFYLTWINENNVGYYNIYRSFGADTLYSRLDSTFDTFYEDFPTLHGNYRYRITIVGSNGLESEPTQPRGAFFDGRLDPPDQLFAVDRGLSTRVSWSPVPWSAAYIIFRSDDGSTFHQIARVGGAYFEMTDTPPQAGSYYYKIATETVDGVISQLSAPVSVYFSDNLARPENVVAENFGTFVIVDWNPVSDAGGYNIYRSTTANGNYVEIGTSNTPEFRDVPQYSGPYYYKVTATDNLGHESPMSFYAYTIFFDRPLPPWNVAAEDLGFKARLHWDTEDTSYSFIIFRSGSSNGSYYPIDTVIADTEAFDWPDAGGHYYYKIQAVSSAQNVSDLSDYAHLYFSGVLPAPSGLMAVNHGTYIGLTWNSVEGASEYDILRGANQSNLDLIQTVYSTGTTDAPDSAGTYYYAVTAKTPGGLESPVSAPVEVVFGP